MAREPEFPISQIVISDSYEESSPSCFATRLKRPSVAYEREVMSIGASLDCRALVLGKGLLAHRFEVLGDFFQRQTSKNTIQHDEQVSTLTAHPSLKTGLSNLN